MPELSRIPVMRAAALGPLFTRFDEWAASLQDGACTSYCVAPSARVAIDIPDAFRRDAAARHPWIHDVHYRPTHYAADALNLTFFPEAILAARHVLLHRHAPQLGELVAISESIGYGMTMGCDFASPEQELHKESEGIVACALGVPPDPSFADPDCLDLVLSAVNNYGHWHAHVFSLVLALRPMLPALLAELGARCLRIVSPVIDAAPLEELKHVTRALLADMVPVEILSTGAMDRPLLLRNVLIGSTNSLDNGPNWSVAFRGLFPALRVRRDPDAPRLIYCDRSHAGTRGIANEAELADALRARGFAIIEAGRLTYDAQRVLFSNAEVVVGSHGGSLTNLLYSHARPLVVELTHDCYGTTQYQWFRSLAAVMGCRYAPFVSPVPETYRGRSYTDTFFDIDVASFMELLPVVG